jgi:hypothetical protein
MKAGFVVMTQEQCNSHPSGRVILLPSKRVDPRTAVTALLTYLVIKPTHKVVVYCLTYSSPLCWQKIYWRYGTVTKHSCIVAELAYVYWVIGLTTCFDPSIWVIIRSTRCSYVFQSTTVCCNVHLSLYILKT